MSLHNRKWFRWDLPPDHHFEHTIDIPCVLVDDDTPTATEAKAPRQVLMQPSELDGRMVVHIPHTQPH